MDERAATASPESWAGRAAGPRCPVEVALTVLDGRWKTLIVWRLFWGARPFCELMRSTEGITKKTLRRQLAELERHGLVHRRQRPGGRRRAEYALTPFGETLKPIVGQIYVWGLALLDEPAGRRAAAYGAGDQWSNDVPPRIAGALSAAARPPRAPSANTQWPFPEEATS